MKEPVRHFDPWEMLWGQPYIDASRLAEAIEEDLKARPDPDFRSRLLVRDATRALMEFWGQTRFKHWLMQSKVNAKITAILQEELGESGFHNIKKDS